jgi:predicted dehydrogenase
MKGKLGKILSFTATRLLDHLIDPDSPMTWRLKKQISGSGVIGDLLSHVIDLARWFCGEPETVISLSKIFIKERPISYNSKKKEKVDVEDDAIALFEFKNGATGYLGASGIRSGKGTAFGEVEINGELGSIHWNFNNMNRIEINYRKGNGSHLQGFKTVEVSLGGFPYFEKWHFPGFLIGFNDLFMNNAYCMMDSIINDKDLEPGAATFEDGYKAVVICDAIIESSGCGKKVKIEY